VGYFLLSPKSRTKLCRSCRIPGVTSDQIVKNLQKANETVAQALISAQAINSDCLAAGGGSASAGTALAAPLAYGTFGAGSAATVAAGAPGSAATVVAGAPGSAATVITGIAASAATTSLTLTVVPTSTGVPAARAFGRDSEDLYV
jgi:hypothetical protein